MSNQSNDNSDAGLNASNAEDSNNSMGDAGHDSETCEASDLTDVVLSFMERTGLAARLKCEIGKFIHENGLIISDIERIQTRADVKLLSSIHEYLQWVGMKQTSAILLSESPVSLNVRESNDTDQEPLLFDIFNKWNRISEHESLLKAQQFLSPSTMSQTKLNNSSSINVGNRTYTANTETPDKVTVDPRGGNNNTGNLTRTSIYYTPGSISNTYFSAIGNEEENITTESNNDVRLGKETETVQILKLIEKNQEKDAGESDSETENRKHKRIIIPEKEDSVSSSIKVDESLKSEPVDSLRPEGLREIGDNSEKSESGSAQNFFKVSDTNDKSQESPTRSPTFLSPSSSSEHISQSKHDDPNNRNSENVENPTTSRQPEMQEKQNSDKEEDTCDESISELLSSLAENNTRDVSIAGSTSAADSKELLSCDHIVNL